MSADLGEAKGLDIEWIMNGQELSSNYENILK
jgi:hypothetical protein